MKKEGFASLMESGVIKTSCTQSASKETLFYMENLEFGNMVSTVLAILKN